MEFPLFISRLSSVILPHVHAAEDWGSTLGGPNKDVASIWSIIPLIKNAITAALSFSGVVLFVMLISGGFTFLFAGGDPKAAQKAQGTITSAIIGLVIIAAAFLILRVIESFTGVNVTNMNLNIAPGP
jgi:hypothetical protein